MVDPTPITDAGLAELERLERAATPGPWELRTDAINPDLVLTGPAGLDLKRRDAKLMEHARNALPSLVHRLRTAEARMTELEAERRIMTEGLTESQKQHGAALDARDAQRDRAEKADAEIARLMDIQRRAAEAAFREGFADGKRFEAADDAWAMSALNGAVYDPEAPSRPDPAQPLDMVQRHEKQLSDWTGAHPVFGPAHRAYEASKVAQPGQSSAQPAAPIAIEVGCAKRSDCWEAEKICQQPHHWDDGIPYCDVCGLYRQAVHHATPPAAGSAAGKEGGS